MSLNDRNFRFARDSAGNQESSLLGSFASQSQHGIRTRCASGRYCRSSQRQQQHCDGGKCKHSRVERAYFKQKGTKQMGCGHSAKQTQATANSRKPGAGTQEYQDHSTRSYGALVARFARAAEVCATLRPSWAPAMRCSAVALTAHPAQ